jgi:hypothetical protein
MSTLANKLYVVLALNMACLYAGHSAVLVSLNDPLTTDEHFEAGATLTLTENGTTVSLTHNAPGDETAIWGVDGIHSRVSLSGLTHIAIVPTASIASGQWGLAVNWFNAGGGYESSTEIQSPTTLTGVQEYVVFPLAPGSVTGGSFNLTLRVFDSGGAQGAGSYGFTFDNISAIHVVPEPNTLGCAAIGVILLALRRTRLMSRWTA